MASAQVKSSIILAALYADSNSVIRQPALSRNHTEIMLAAFGGNINVDRDNKITIGPTEELFGRDLIVPGDISSAAYFITAAMLTPKSKIILRNVGINPTRSGILDVYKAMGAEINIEEIGTSKEEPSADILVKTSCSMLL